MEITRTPGNIKGMHSYSKINHYQVVRMTYIYIYMRLFTIKTVNLMTYYADGDAVRLEKQRCGCLSLYLFL